MNEDEEVWRTISGFPDYAVSNYGRVMRTCEGRMGARPKVLKPGNAKQNNPLVGLYKEGGPHSKLISRLVCSEFNGPAPSLKHHASHNDGNRANNNASNLRWATISEKIAENPESRLRGEKHGKAKLTESDVMSIRREIKYWGSGKLLAKRYGVNESTISDILSKKIWRHL